MAIHINKPKSTGDYHSDNGVTRLRVELIGEGHVIMMLILKNPDWMEQFANGQLITVYKWTLKL